ncbi:MAG: hypothetical protein RSC15_07690, partial [Lactococcus sp.]
AVKIIFYEGGSKTLANLHESLRLTLLALAKERHRVVQPDAVKIIFYEGGSKTLANLHESLRLTLLALAR